MQNLSGLGIAKEVFQLGVGGRVPSLLTVAGA